MLKKKKRIYSLSQLRQLRKKKWYLKSKRLLMTRRKEVVKLKISQLFPTASTGSNVA